MDAALEKASLNQEIQRHASPHVALPLLDTVGGDQTADRPLEWVDSHAASVLARWNASRSPYRLI